MQDCRKGLAVKAVTGMLLLAWPFVVWFGLSHNSLRWLLPLMALLLMLRLRQARQISGPMRIAVQSVAVAGIALCVTSAWLESHQLLLFYPVVINLVMLCVFGGSLLTTMPLVERLARFQHPDLPPQGVRYTRRVTQIWCVFFIVNGAIALFTALRGDMQLWTLWNGMIAYVLMGMLMAGEWLTRRRVIKRGMP